MILRDWRGRIRHGHRRLRIILGILASVATTAFSPPSPTIAAVLVPLAPLLFSGSYKASVRTIELWAGFPWI